MPWVRLDDGFPEHPKLRAAGPLGRELFVAALCHSNRYLTDGRLTMDDLCRLGQYDDIYLHDPLSVVEARPTIEEVVERLIVADALHYLDGFIHIHDYADYQPTKAQVLTERERARERRRQQRERKGLSGFENGMSQRTSGRGTTEREDLEPQSDARAREAFVCPSCGPMPFKTERQLLEHFENVHPELAEATT